MSANGYTGFTAALRKMVLNLPDDVEFCSCDFKELRINLGNSERGVLKTLTRLCEHGEIIEVKRTKSRRGRNTIWYKVSPSTRADDERKKLIAKAGNWAGLFTKQGEQDDIL